MSDELVKSITPEKDKLILANLVKSYISENWIAVVDEATKLAHIAGLRMGIPHILDKYKYREARTAAILGHKVSKQSCGVQLPDAVDKCNQACEYKNPSKERPKGRKLQLTGIYSSANVLGNIECVLQKQHYFAAYQDEEPWLIIQVNTQIVYQQLMEAYEKKSREEKEKGKKDNLNFVKILVNLSNPKTDVYTIKYLKEK